MTETLLFKISQLLILISIIMVIILLLLTRKSFNLEKRVTKFSISSITEKQTSFFDRFIIKYNDLVSKLSKSLIKFKIFKKYSQRYDKYIDKTKMLRNKSIDIISNKFLIGFIAIFITIISDVLRRHYFSALELFIAFIVGFYLPDIILIIKDKRRAKRIENDLFKAVLIMSNAFKSGRSVMQAVKIVSEELDGPISEEFKKAYIDLTYGLELEVVFERLSNRIKLEETKYMASSLVILNKTGGNVVEVFNSIERSFFDRKKLNDELKSVTALSNFVFKILVAIPFIIFIMIYILNPHYFEPFVSTAIGKIILGLIILLYVIYIIVVKKIIKIRE